MKDDPPSSNNHPKGRVCWKIIQEGFEVLAGYKKSAHVLSPFFLRFTA